MAMLKDLKLKHNIYQKVGITKNYNEIINRKKVYNQTSDSDIKRYEQIRKLTTGQGQDYISKIMFIRSWLSQKSL